jgi:hypothetical protein
MHFFERETPMSLNIATFNNKTGPSILFKALGHPLTAKKLNALLKELEKFKSVAIYDPNGNYPTFSSLYDLSAIAIERIYVQDVEDITSTKSPISNLKTANHDAVLILSYDSSRLGHQINHLVPEQTKIFSLDDARLEDSFLSNKNSYLDKLNFATNFAFFRDDDTYYTRLMTADYWSGYGAKGVQVWFHLVDSNGKELCTWQEKVASKGAAILVDSRDIRKKFNLPPFTGQLFVHMTGIAGHEIIKYALDTHSHDGETLSATHDANAYPSDYFAGLPAPKEDEKVIFWVQNSHPTKIPAGQLEFNVMGEEKSYVFDKEVPAFGSYELDMSTLMPDIKWPQQIEIDSKKHFVRPRYEIIRNGKRHIAHANVERTDLKPDPKLREFSNLMGKGHVLPAPLLPLDQFETHMLHTPMVRASQEFGLMLHCYDANGQCMAQHKIGRVKRNGNDSINISQLLREQNVALPSSYGHIELLYDFTDGVDGDGWLHGLFRYENKNGHTAETSFGSHIYNTIVTYKNEPQSYAGPAPGLSTRLFLRLGDRNQYNSFCHLVYAASTPWHKESTTDLILHSGKGEEITRTQVNIACSGSLHWTYWDMFDKADRDQAGDGAYVMIRDTTCRLFGYHGLITKDKKFSLDHMFGF